MSEAIRVLLVEDDENDVRITRRALNRSGVAVELEVAASGSAALELLADASRRPNLILLDLNLPGMHGFELLERIKRDAALELSAIPVLILTTSRQDDDVQRAYAAGAAGFVPKPVAYGAFASVIAQTMAWWAQVCILPGRKA